MSKIPIFLASNENYAPFLCTTMYSVLEHTQSFIEFHVLDGGIEDESKELIKKSLEKFKNFSITYHNMSEFDLERFPNLFHLSTSAYSRFFIPQIVKNHSKVIYLDVDIIVKGDILELYNVDLEGYPLAAALHIETDSGNFIKEKVYPELQDPAKYFNSGVLIFDINKFVSNNYTEKLIQTCLKYKDKIQYADQDVFNILFENNFKILDYKFNYFPRKYSKYKQFLGIEDAKIPYNNSIILHYIGGGTDKPWYNKSIKASKFFWQTVSKTKFKKRVKKIFEDFNNANKEKFIHILFSVRNQGNHKVWTILGIKFKLRRSNNLQTPLCVERE